MQHRVQDTVHHSQKNKREAPNSPSGKSLCVNKVNFPDFFFFLVSFPLSRCVTAAASVLGAEIAPGHNITGHKRCFDTSYMREENRRDELTEAQELIQEQEGKKGKKITLPLSKQSSQSGLRVAALLGDRRICV